MKKVFKMVLRRSSRIVRFMAAFSTLDRFGDTPNIYHANNYFSNKAVMKKLGLVRLENENENFSMFVKMLGNLAWLPPAQMKMYWTQGIQVFAM